MNMTESATNRFIQAIIPQGLTLCLARHRTLPDSSRPKLPFRNIFVGPKANGALHKNLTLAQTETDTNWYIAVAGYDESSRRKAENVKGIKCLVLDVDLKPDPKFFSAKHEVLPAIKNLHKNVPDLPKPWVIDSGNGIHIYYAINETLTTEQWGPIASLFADVVRAIEPKLIADPVRTRDAASVMRLPGSWNAKQANRLLVKPLIEGTSQPVDVIKASLAVAAAKHNVSGVDAILGNELLPNMPSLPSYMDVPADLDFGGGMDAVDRIEFKDLNLRPIIEGCKQMRQICEVRGNVPEPQWVNFLRVLNTVANSDDVACYFSSGHPTYNEAATRRKMRHIRQNFESASAGCKEFKEISPSACRNCPNAKRIWTPSQLGVLDAQEKEIKAAEVEATESVVSGETTEKGYIIQPAYAKQDREAGAGYEITYLPVRQSGKDGKIVKEPIVAGHINLVRSTARLVSKVVSHKEQVAVTDVNVHMDVVTQKRKNRVVCPSVDMTSTGFDKSTETLRKSGLVFECGTLGQKAAISKYLQQLVKLANNRRVFYRPVKGWLKIGNLGDWSFVAGARHYLPGGKVEENVTSAEHMGLDRRHEGFMERACTGIPKGELNRWQRGMSVYNGSGLEIAQLLLLSGLSNMLLPLLSGDKGGIVLALTGESGVGKTTLIDFMASFMGDHFRYVIPGSSTTNALGMLLQQANCMMLAVDDTMSRDGEVFSSLLTMVTGGADKMRMTWDSKTGGTVPYEEGFNASLLLTSNYSTTATIGTAGRGKDQLQAEAARTRTLEFPSHQIVVPHSITKEDWSKARSLITNNHGHAVARFLRYVVDNQVAVTNGLRRLESEIAKRLRAQVTRDKAGQVRFWARFLAVSGMTASIVCLKLNLLPWKHLNILAAGEQLVAETVSQNMQSDDDLIESFWAVSIEEPNPHNPSVNFVTRRAELAGWPSWQIADRAVRMRNSDWTTSTVSGDASSLPTAAGSNRWRVDTIDIADDDGWVHRERTVYMPMTELKNLIAKESGNRLPVADWSDLYTRLRSAGCVILGVLDRQPDKLSKPEVRIDLAISKFHARSFSRKVVEIRLPPQMLY
jgi:hypothetical protein